MRAVPVGVRMDIFPSEMSAFIGNTSATVRRPPVSVSYSTVDPIRTTFPWCRRVGNHACPFELGQGTIGNIGKAISRGERKFVQSLVINIAHHDRRLSPSGCVSSLFGSSLWFTVLPRFEHHWSALESRRSTKRRSAESPSPRRATGPAGGPPGSAAPARTEPVAKARARMCEPQSPAKPG